MRSVVHHHRPWRFFAPAGAALAIALLAATPLRLPETKVKATERSLHAYATQTITAAEDRVQHVIIIGGIVLERNRHLAAGSAVGCLIGAGIGTAVTGALALATGGAGLATLPTTMTLGCALLGSAGAVLGSPLDDYQMDLSDLDDGK